MKTVSKGRILKSANRQMEVTVKLHGILRRYRPEKSEGSPHHPFTMTCPLHATVDDILSFLGIGHGIGFVVAVNGEAAELATPLDQGDIVYLFPPAAGG